MAAQTPIPIYGQQETFYVPQVQVYVDGKELQDNVISDILQITYKDSVNEIDSFTIEINNWDADARTFKFAPPLKTATEDYTGIFDPGSTLELFMGYQNNMRLMMRGQVTSLAPSFTESAAPTLSVSGLNELHQFRTEQHTRSWLDGKMTDTQIVTQLCNLPIQKGQAGLGIGIDPNPSPNEMPAAFVFMNNQYDIVFILELARRNGYEVYIEDGNGSGKSTLYFGLSGSNALAPTYQLEWGKSLINFRPTLATAKQVSTVTVRGWDRTSNSVIEQSCSLQDLWKSQNKSASEIARLTQIAQAYGNRTEVVTDKPVHTVKEAKDLAQATLDNQSKKLIEATGSTVGLPDLRSGCALRIIGFGVKTSNTGTLTGASSDFDGEYYVTETTHTIGGGGYQTEFSARREGPVGSQ
jgi:phage protein D